MSLVTRASDASLDMSSGVFAPQITGNLYAGEDLDAAAPCRIHSDGKVMMSNGAAADANAGFDGFTPKDYKQGEPVTLFGIGARFKYGSGLTPGATLYIAGTDGRLDDAATTGDPNGVVRVINATDVRVIRNA